MSDPFSAASDSFVKMEHLKGRLLLITMTGVTGQRESTQKGQAGKFYDWIETDTVVLDGEETDMIDEIPTLLEGFQFSGGYVVGTLRPKVRKQGMVLGRLTTKAVPTGIPPWVFTKPTEEDNVLARKYLAANPPDAKPDPFNSAASESAPW